MTAPPGWNNGNWDEDAVTDIEEAELETTDIDEETWDIGTGC